jgi:hypothetical protein
MVFGIGLSVAPIGEQSDNLEAIGRAAAYQDCHRHRATTILTGETRGAGRSAALEFSRATTNMANHCFGRCDGHHKMAIPSCQSPLQRTPAAGRVQPPQYGRRAACHVLSWSSCRPFEGRLTPRFRTIQVCPKDPASALRHAERAVNRPKGPVGARIGIGEEKSPCSTSDDASS